LLVVLAAGAASTDALSYLGLGQVFPANMTGNTVLLAIGTASRYASAIRSLLALGGFVVGAFVAGLATRRGQADIWASRIRAVLLLEFAVQAAALGWWLTLPDHPHGAAQHALIPIFGVTMGLQSAAISRLPVGVSTTYITGTLTAVCVGAAGRLLAANQGSGSRSAAHPHVAVLACYLLVALGTGIAYRVAGSATLAIPAGAVAAVILGLCRRDGPREISDSFATSYGKGS
jgi:uncharacterized membrane protein YoaK (UPF0700 family)